MNESPNRSFQEEGDFSQHEDFEVNVAQFCEATIQSQDSPIR